MVCISHKHFSNKTKYEKKKSQVFNIFYNYTNFFFLTLITQSVDVVLFMDRRDDF